MRTPFLLLSLLCVPAAAVAQELEDERFGVAPGEREVLEGGERRVLFADGQLKCAGRLVDGRREGGWFVFHRNGRLAERRHYRQGQLFGVHMVFAADGRLVAQGHHNHNTDPASVLQPPRDWPARGSTPPSLAELAGKQQGDRTLAEHLRVLLESGSDAERQGAAEALVAGYGERLLVHAFATGSTADRLRILPVFPRIYNPRIYRLYPWLEDPEVGAAVRRTVTEVAARAMTHEILDPATRAMRDLAPAAFPWFYPVLASPEWLREVADAARKSVFREPLPTAKLVEVLRKGSDDERLQVLGRVEGGRGDAGLLLAMLDLQSQGSEVLQRYAGIYLPRRVPVAVVRNERVRARLRDPDQRVAARVALWLAHTDVERKAVHAALPELLRARRADVFALALEAVGALGDDGARYVAHVDLAGHGTDEHAAFVRLCRARLPADATARAQLIALGGHESSAVSTAALLALSDHLGDARIRAGVRHFVLGGDTPLATRRRGVRALFDAPLGDAERRDLLLDVIRVPELFPEARLETARGRVPRRAVVSAWVAAAKAWAKTRPPTVLQATPLEWWPPAAPGPLQVVCAWMPRTEEVRRTWPTLSRGFAFRTDAEIAADLEALGERGYDWAGANPVLPMPESIAPGRRGRDAFVGTCLDAWYGKRRHSPTRCGPVDRPHSAIARLGQSIVPALVRRLGEKDPRKRATLLGALAATAREVPNAIAPRETLYGDRPANPEVVAALVIPFFEDADVQVQVAALLALRELGRGYAAAVPKLAAMLDDSRLGGSACAALARLGPAAAAALPGMLDRLDSDLPTHYATIGALAALQPRVADVLPRLLAMLRAGKRQAVPALARLAPDSDEAARALAATWDHGPEWQRALLQAFCAFGPTARPILPRLVKDLDGMHVDKLETGGIDARLRVLCAMGEAARPVVPVFLAYADRPASATALAQLAPDRLAEQLGRRSLCDPVWQELEMKAPFALFAILGRLPPRVQDIVDPIFPSSRARAEVPIPFVLPTEALVHVVRRRRAASFRGAVNELIRCDPTHPEVLPLLEDRVWASQRLELDPDQDLPRLLRLWLGDRDPRFRRAACELLLLDRQLLGELVPELRALRDDPDPGVRVAARVAAGVALHAAAADGTEAGRVGLLLVEGQSSPRAVDEDLLPAALRKLASLAPDELRYADNLGAALAASGKELAPHAAQLAAIVAGPCPFVGQRIAIELLGVIGEPAQAALPALRAVPEDDPLRRYAVIAIERITR